MSLDSRSIGPGRLPVSMAEGEARAEIRDIAAWAALHQTSFAALICEWATRGGIHALARYIRDFTPAGELDAAASPEVHRVTGTAVSFASPEPPPPCGQPLLLRERTPTMPIDTAFFQRRWNRLVVLQQELKRQLRWSPVERPETQQRLRLVELALYSTWADLEACRQAVTARP